MKADIFLAMKYERLVMRLDEICFELSADIGTTRNRMSAGTFPIPTRKEGKFVVADVRDVGKYLDDCRDEALRRHREKKYTDEPNLSAFHEMTHHQERCFKAKQARKQKP